MALIRALSGSGGSSAKPIYLMTCTRNLQFFVVSNEELVVEPKNGANVDYSDDNIRVQKASGTNTATITVKKACESINYDSASTPTKTTTSRSANSSWQVDCTANTCYVVF